MKKPWRYHGECPSGGQAAKTLGACGPSGILPWDLPRHNIHHNTSLAFSNNVPVCGLQCVLFRLQVVVQLETLDLSRGRWSQLAPLPAAYSGLSAVTMPPALK